VEDEEMGGWGDNEGEQGEQGERGEKF